MGSELGSSWFSSRASSPVRLGPLLALLHSLLLLQWESLKPSPYVHGLYLLFRSIEVCVRVVCCNGFTLGTCRTCTQCIHSHSVLVWGMCNSYELCAFPIIINQLNPFYLCYVWSQSTPRVYPSHLLFRSMSMNMAVMTITSARMTTEAGMPTARAITR